jgi:hypothetical protein
MARRKARPLVKFKGRCIDCPDGSPDRMVARPGPRCQTHRIERRRKLRSAAHDAHVLKTYSISGEEYWNIWYFQEMRCAVCLRATGSSKRLAVDHDHALGSGRDSVRGLLCSNCNQMLGHARDDIKFFQRAIEYLTNPPARAVLERKEP